MIEINIVNRNQQDLSWFDKHEPQKGNREVIFQLKENHGLHSKIGSTDTQDEPTLIAQPAESNSNDNIEGQTMSVIEQSFQKVPMKPVKKRR